MKKAQTHNRHRGPRARRRQDRGRGAPAQFRLDDARHRGAHARAAAVREHEEAERLRGGVAGVPEGGGVFLLQCRGRRSEVGCAGGHHPGEAQTWREGVLEYGVWVLWEGWRGSRLTNEGEQRAQESLLPGRIVRHQPHQDQGRHGDQETPRRDPSAPQPVRRHPRNRRQ